MNRHGVGLWWEESTAAARQKEKPKRSQHMVLDIV
jgi:hypothetical protein